MADSGKTPPLFFRKRMQLFRLFSISFILTALVVLLWPYFQYFIDPDAVSYLNLANDYMHHYYEAAINGYWSPMGIWLTAIFAHLTGWPLFPSAIFVNTIGACLALFSGQILFDKFRENEWERWCFGISMALFWAYVVYMQSFTDAWQVFFLLLGLLLLLKENFEKHVAYWILAGIIGALSYFGKAYSFYFFPIMAIIVIGLKLKEKDEFSWKKLISVFCVIEGTLLLCAFPWLYLLHQKYGFWTASTAGSLNLSWNIDGSYNLKKGLSVLLPPPNTHSLFYFEDSLMIQGHITHFWDSAHTALKMISRVGYNLLLWIKSCYNLSTFYFVIWLLTIAGLFFSTKKDTKPKNIRILQTILIVFPLPFFLIHFDNGRYLWFTIPISMILGMCLFEKLRAAIRPKWFEYLFIAIFFLSYSVHPIMELKSHFGFGKKQYEQAQALKEFNIKGSFVSNLSWEDGKRILPPLTWFSGNPWYCHSLSKYTTEEILKDARRYHVKYFFYFYQGVGANFQLTDSNGNNYPELTYGSIPGLKVFYLNF